MSRVESAAGFLRPPGFRGAAFSTAIVGDARSGTRDAVAAALEIPAEWATARQVHADRVVFTKQPGCDGEADALFTDQPGLPVAVFTADCAGVVVEAAGAVGVAHAGWRGAAAGVVEALIREMIGSGHRPERAAIGPTIGPCCFEVGPEVAERFPHHIETTTWGTASVDLPGAVVSQLPGIEVWMADQCTRCSTRYHSHRRDATSDRMAAIGWLP